MNKELSVQELLNQYDYCFSATSNSNPKFKKYELAKELLNEGMKLKDYWKNK